MERKLKSLLLVPRNGSKEAKWQRRREMRQHFTELQAACNQLFVHANSEGAAPAPSTPAPNRVSLLRPTQSIVTCLVLALHARAHK